MRSVKFLIESWPLKVPFRITGHTFISSDLLYVEITEDGVTGRGEGTGIYYKGERAETMLAQGENVRQVLEQGADRDEISAILPIGGARNAIDCALWDLEAKKSGKSIWEMTGITPKQVYTVNTVGIDTVEAMAEAARNFDTPKLKVKLDGEKSLERITAVCQARPDAEVVVDVNQGWTFEQLVEFAPKFKELGIAMIEQPLPRGGDEQLEGYDCPVLLCGDESCLDTSELEQASRRYKMINIKLDKTGGLTEALALARAAQAKGLGLMVGNMTGTSLGMAPSFVIAQMCDFIDLDGPVLLKEDREHALGFAGGLVTIPEPALWG